MKKSNSGNNGHKNPNTGRQTDAHKGADAHRKTDAHMQPNSHRPPSANRQPDSGRQPVAGKRQNASGITPIVSRNPGEYFPPDMSMPLRNNSHNRGSVGNADIQRISNGRRRQPKPAKRVMKGLPNQNGPRTVAPVGYLRKRKRKLTGRQMFTRIGVSVAALLVVLAIGATFLYNYLWSGLNYIPNKANYPTEALTNQPPQSKDITNILLLGVDTRHPGVENGLSDSIIILTIDRKNNVIKMSSIMRDCYVYIPGRKNPSKINAAHSFGGPELALRTINSTLRLNIEKYMVVNMKGMASIIDIAGGVTVDVTSGEMKDMNKRLYSYGIHDTGFQKLTGKQAVEYARIRKIDSDYERAARQREVLKALFKSFISIDPVKKAQMIKEGITYITTNMKPSEITALGIDILPKMTNEIQEMRLPPEGYYEVNTSGEWHMLVDYNRMIPEVYKFIYGETKAFDPVPTIYHRSNGSGTTYSKSNSAYSSSSSGGQVQSSQSVDSISASIDSSSQQSSQDSSSSSSAASSPTPDVTATPVPTLPASPTPLP
jgi:LCP family protein required for cell wall assembly